MNVPGGLEQIVDNYIDNAMNVAAAGDTVTLSATPRPHSVSVRVIDANTGRIV